MKKLLLCLMMSVVAANAAVISLAPEDGLISGTPGSTVGWGFNLASDPLAWTSITGVVPLGESNPTLGLFIDLITPQGGPVFGALPPGGPDWVQAFDPLNFLGFGSYSIDPTALPGDGNTGTFLVLYETFSGNPATCGSCFLDSGVALVPFAVTVVAAPEPASTALLGLALMVVALRRARR